jgi:hypothetical protein
MGPIASLPHNTLNIYITKTESGQRK